MWWHMCRNQILSRQNRRVHLNRRACQFSQLLAAEVCTSALLMLDTPRSEVVREYWLPTHSPVSPSLPLPCITVCHQVSNALYQQSFRSEHSTLPSSVNIKYVRFYIHLSCGPNPVCCFRNFGIQRHFLWSIEHGLCSRSGPHEALCCNPPCCIKCWAKREKCAVYLDESVFQGLTFSEGLFDVESQAELWLEN